MIVSISALVGDVVLSEQQYVIISMGLYLVTTVVLKVSLAILFLRVVVKPFQRHIICAATVVYAIYGVVFAFIAIFQCGDPRDFLLHAAEHKCLSNEVLQPLNYVCGVLNAMTDWIFATMAILVVWQSNMPRATKLTAGFLLGLGALGSICSIARLPYIPGLKAGPSFLGNSIKIAIWSIIEPGLGIVAASLSTLRPLFKSLLERTRSLTSSGRHHTSRPRRTYDNRGSGLSFGDRNASQFHQVQDDYRSTITTVVGNAKAGTSLELRDIGYNPDKVMSLDEESERRDSVGHSLKRSESQKRLRRQESQRSLSRYPPSPSTCPSPSQAWVSNGRVVMTKQVNVHDFSV
ncbi:hypothetical protein MBLNU459_g4973t1 [Dothideomycetes sp. NU459]